MEVLQSVYFSNTTRDIHEQAPPEGSANQTGSICTLQWPQRRQSQRSPALLPIFGKQVSHLRSDLTNTAFQLIPGCACARRTWFSLSFHNMRLSDALKINHLRLNLLHPSGLHPSLKKKKKCTVKGGRIELEKIQAEKIKITPPQFLLLCA